MEGVIEQWFAQFIRPILGAALAADLPGAREHYFLAKGSLADEPDADLRHAKLLRLDTAWFFALGELADLREAGAVFEALKAACRDDLPGPLSRQRAALSELQSRLHADYLGLEAAPDEIINGLIAAVPEDLQGPNYWDPLAYWAFTRGKAELLEAAYVYFTTHRMAVMSEWMFDRLLLMLSLLRQTATIAAICETIRRIELGIQFKDFQQVLLPVIHLHGLATPVVQAALTTKRMELIERGQWRKE